MKRSNIIVLFAVLLATALAGAARSGKKGVPQADLSKADYIYLEAVTAGEEGRFDDRYMLLRRAASLNPDDPFIQAALASMDITLATADSLMREDAYAKLARRFAVAPTDVQNYQMYVSLASYLGRHDDVVNVWETLDSLMPSRTDPAFNLAYSLLARYAATLDTADYNRAVAILDRLENAVGPTIPLTMRKIRAYSLRKDSLAIERDLLRLAASAPTDIETNLFVGRVFSALNRPDSTLAYLDRARELDPDDGTVNLARAEFFNMQGDSIAFDREVFLALQSQSIEFPDKLQLLTDYVVNLYNDSLQRPRIEHMFETMQEVNPGEAGLHDLYGAYKATVGEYAEAVEQFSYAIDLKADNKKVWQNLISVYIELEHYDDVLATAQRALTVFPGDYMFALVASGQLAFRKDYDGAISVLDSIDMTGVPDDKLSLIYSSRGDYLYMLERKDEAFAAYNKAIEADPSNYMAMNNCAYYMAVAGTDLDRAELYASMATSAEENPTYIDTYAWVLFMKKEYHKAKEQIDRVLKAYGEIDGDRFVEHEELDETAAEPQAEYYSHAGDIYFMCGERRVAVDLWRKALKLKPDDALLKKKVEHKTIFFE